MKAIFPLKKKRKKDTGLCELYAVGPCIQGFLCLVIPNKVIWIINTLLVYNQIGYKRKLDSKNCGRHWIKGVAFYHKNVNGT